jgi:hypothetical protein
MDGSTNLYTSTPFALFLQIKENYGTSAQIRAFIRGQYSPPKPFIRAKERELKPELVLELVIVKSGIR